MIVECNNCHKRYKVPDDKIPPEGRNIKCPNCQSIIFVYKPLIAESEPVGLFKEEEKKKESQSTCPKCGSTNIVGDECRNCGIFISKYLKIQQKKEEKRNSSKSLYPPIASSMPTSSKPPLFNTKPSFSLRLDAPIVQSRQAMITAALLLIISALIYLNAARYEMGSAYDTIGPAIVDIVVAIGLLMNIQRFRILGLIRAVLGMVIFGCLAIYHSNLIEFFVEIVVNSAIILLLTGKSTKTRIVLSIGLFAAGYLVLFFFGPSDLDMLSENVVNTGSSTITSKQYPYSITIPSTKWQLLEKSTLHDEADIEMFNKDPEAYCLTFAGPTYDASLQDIKADSIQTWKENEKSLKVIEEKDTTVKTYGAVQMIHTARVEGVNVKYFHVIIQADRNYYEILCWSEDDDFSESLYDFKRIVNSFKIK